MTVEGTVSIIVQLHVGGVLGLLLFNLNLLDQEAISKHFLFAKRARNRSLIKSVLDSITQLSISNAERFVDFFESLLFLKFLSILIPF